MRLTPDQRYLIGDAVDRGINKSLLARVFGISKTTIYKWDKRRKHLKDRKRKPRRSKISVEVEYSILALRNTFNWGTARIQQGLRSLPGFVRQSVPGLVQNVNLSRTAINNILKKHKLNGYKKKHDTWKFFRAKKPNELWQIDLKGPFRLQGRKLWFVICIDDHSRYIILNKCLHHCPDTQKVFNLLKKFIKKHKPKKILSDNGSQFREKWKKLCKEYQLKTIFAHPYYPQDKGKVERAIRNIAEEFINLLKKFPEWLNEITAYTHWFNNQRFHRGINTVPQALYS